MEEQRIVVGDHRRKSVLDSLRPLVGPREDGSLNFSKENKVTKNVENSDDSDDDCNNSETIKDAEEESELALNALALVAKRRTMQRNNNNAVLDRLKKVFGNGDPVFVVYQLLCEVADKVLTKYQRILEISGGWEDYEPGAVFHQGREDDNDWLNLFVQIVCGWQDASVAFGPIMVEANAQIVKDLNLGGHSSLHLFGTLEILESRETLPRGIMTEKVLALSKSAVELSLRANMQQKGRSLIVMAKFANAVKAELLKIEQVQLGEGGTPKHPTEFQMHYVHRINLAVLEAFDGITLALGKF